MEVITLTQSLALPADDVQVFTDFISYQAMMDGGSRLTVALPSGVEYALGILVAVGAVLLVRFIVSLKIW